MATVPMTTTTKAVQEAEYTNLQLALSRGFAKDLARFWGSEEAAAAYVAEIYNQARRAPKIHECSVESIRLAVAKTAALRLNPALPNMVAFIPRGKELHADYGYAGLRALVTRHPDVVDCFTKEVCVNDEYVVPADLISPPLHRLPSRFTPRGRVEGYYATIKLVNGHWRTLQMSVSEVLAHAKQYVTQPGPAWQFRKDGKGATIYKRPDVDDGLTSFDKQALKTVLRMLCNGRDVPMTAEALSALREEDDASRTPTAAELQGYDRQGNRPALTESTGLPLDDLMQDVYGTRDKVAVEREMVHATQGTRQAEAEPPIDVDPRTGVVLEEPTDDDAPTAVDSKTGRVVGESKGKVSRQGQMAFSPEESARREREDEAQDQPSNAGKEGS